MRTEYPQLRKDGDRRFGSIMLTSPRSTLMSVGSASMHVRRRNLQALLNGPPARRCRIRIATGAEFEHLKPAAAGSDAILPL